MNTKKYDVAILGLWYGLNYGSLLTYYALREQIRSVGKSVVMVKYLPENLPDSIIEEQDPRAHNNSFITSQGYDTHTLYRHNARSVNELADTFVIGSDQVWNYPIAKLYDSFFYMSEIDSDKRKIANAVSFGHAVDFAPSEEQPRISNLMRRFNAISVREDSGVDILRREYDVYSEWHADPLLTISRSDLCALSDKADTSSSKYLLAYVLDPSDDKINGVQSLAKILGLDIKVIIDGFSHNRENNISYLGELEGTLQNDVDVGRFVSLFEDSSYVVTDSFHGTVMALKMEKEFAVVTTAKMRRGMARIDSLLKLTGLRARHTYDPRAIGSKKRFLNKIDYNKVNHIIDRISKISHLWLTTALDFPVDMKVDSSPVLLEDDDLREIIIGKKSWSFGLQGKNPYTNDAKFLSDGRITGIESDNEYFWEVNNSKFIIYDVDRKPTHIFTLSSLDFGKPIFHGEATFDYSLVHVIS